MNRKKYISGIVVSVLLAVLLSACAEIQTETTPAVETDNGYVIDINLQGLAGVEGDMEDHNIVPFYIPQKVKGEDSVIDNGMELNKGGSSAEVVYKGHQIVQIKYYDLYSTEPKGYDFPSVGQARVIEDANILSIICRLSEDYGCVISSNMVPKEELIEMANSFLLRDEP